MRTSRERCQVRIGLRERSFHDFMFLAWLVFLVSTLYSQYLPTPEHSKWEKLPACFKKNWMEAIEFCEEIRGACIDIPICQ